MKFETRASIDIGSNSVLLLVGEVGQGAVRELLKRCEITSLGRELDNNKAFHPESMSATFEVLKSYIEDCRRLGVAPGSIIATATEASRVAKNAVEFFSEVESKLGLKVNIIDAEAEAYFSTKGILFNTKFSSEVVTLMDVGGASTEFIKVNTKTFQILESISLPVGSVRSTQWLEEELFVQKLQKVFLDFRNEIDRFQTKELYCVAGTITALGTMHLGRTEFSEDAIHGLTMKIEDMDALFKRYSQFSAEQFQETFPFLEKRAKSIRGGLHLVYHLAHRLLVKQLSISTYGLRFGTLLEGRITKEHLYGK